MPINIEDVAVGQRVRFVWGEVFEGRVTKVTKKTIWVVILSAHRRGRVVVEPWQIQEILGEA